MASAGHLADFLRTGSLLGGVRVPPLLPLAYPRLNFGGLPDSTTRQFGGWAGEAVRLRQLVRSLPADIEHARDLRKADQMMTHTPRVLDTVNARGHSEQAPLDTVKGATSMERIDHEHHHHHQARHHASGVVRP